MIKGIYTSALAMRQGILRQEVTANNLANANTTGFKRDRLFVEELTAAAAENPTTDPMSVNTRHWTEFSHGAFNPTSGPLDFALQSDGLFVVNDGQNQFYTRDGHFERSSDGLLVDVVLMDCPPGHAELDRLALQAADVVLAATEAHRLGIAGAARVLDEARALKPRPRCALVLGRVDERRGLDRAAPFA